MKLVADESVAGPTVYALRAAGHEVLFIAETSPGIDDSAVLAVARREEALLVTADKDFGDLVFRTREAHHGVLLIRFAERRLEKNAADTVAVIGRYGPNLLHRFSVLAEGGLRVSNSQL